MKWSQRGYETWRSRFMLPGSLFTIGGIASFFDVGIIVSSGGRILTGTERTIGSIVSIAIGMLMLLLRFTEFREKYPFKKHHKQHGLH